jgi:(p)ppGpp synthase/HD superfamily hydrolase
MLGERFEVALLYACQLHADQKRKQSSVPYIAHLLGVTSIVLEDGGSEDEAIAALLHDAVEDQGGLHTLDEIRAKFGAHVADIVLAVSDSYSVPKLPWRARKTAYIKSIENAPPSAVRVSLADKVYNAHSTLQDVRAHGDAAWEKFNGGKEGTIWYYDELIAAFQAHGPSLLLDELSRLVAEINKLST